VSSHELVIGRLETDISKDMICVNIWDTDERKWVYQELNKEQVIQLRDFLNEFIEANNE
jgi:hypothetical protein